MSKLTLIMLIMLVLVNFSYAQEDSTDNFDLFDKSFEELLEIKVSVASKSIELLYDAPGVITVISRNEINSYAATNLADVINRIAGVIVLSANVFEQNVASFRGQSLTPYDNHTLILINGRPFRDPVAGGWNSTFYSSFPLDIIERIEVIRGPGSVLFGSCAFSGVINIITKSMDEDGVQVFANMNLGNRNTFKQEFAANFKQKDLEFNFGISNYITDGALFSFTDYLGIDSVAYFDRRNIGSFLNVKYKGFYLNTSYLDLNGFGLDPVDNNWDHESSIQHNKHKSSWADVGYSNNLSDKVILDLNGAFHSHYFQESDEIDVFAYSFAFEGTVKYNPVNNLNIIGGVTLENNIHRGLRFIDDNKLTSSIYLQIKYSLLPKFHFIGGFQWNKPEYIKGKISPRAGFIVNFSDKVGAKLLYSEAFRNGYPLETSFDLDVFRGNNELRPEIISTSEIQIFTHSKKLLASLTGFYSVMSDLITRNWYEDMSLPTGGYLKYVNGGGHSFWGAEFEWKYTFLKTLSTTGSVSYQQNENDANIKNASLHPNLMIKVGIMYTGKYVSASIFNSYFGEPTQVIEVNPDVNIVNEIPTSFDLLSAKVSANLSKIFPALQINEFLLNIQVENLLDLDVRYPDYASKGLNSFIPLYNGPTFLIGLSANF